MLGRRIGSNKFVNAMCAAALGTFLIVQNSDVQAKSFTAGSVLKKMGTQEKAAYITGLIHGFAHARYIKDNKNANAGMKCIYDWFHNGGKSVNQILFAFDKYQKNMPNTIVAAMLKQQCGE